MFTATLFTIDKIWKQPKCPSTDEWIKIWNISIYSFPGSAVVKNLPPNAGDARDAASVAGSGRSPGAENGSPLQYSRLENSMDRGAWQATVHGVTKSLT